MAEKLAHRVRRAAFMLGDFSMNDLAGVIGVRSYAEMEKLRQSLKGLRKNGEIMSLRRGYYRYLKPQKPLPMVARMWRAMLIKGTFTRRDVGKLSGGSLSHVHKYFMHLERRGFIVNVSESRGYAEGVFEIADPDHVPLTHPASYRRAPR